MPSNTSIQPLRDRLSHRLLIGLSTIAMLLVVTAITGIQQNLGSSSAKLQPNDHDLMSSLQPSSTATDVTWQVFSDLGELNYEVSAAQLEQYPSQQLIKAVSPSIRMTSQEQPPWVISADRGVITQLPNAHNADAESNQMTLQGHVQILRQGSEVISQLRLSTTLLHVFPVEQRAQTDTPVLLQHERFTTSSEGLDLNLKTGAVVFAQNDGARVISNLLLRD